MNRARSWIGIACFAVVAAIPIFALARQGALSVEGVVIGIVIIAGVFAWFGLRNDARLRSLHRKYPGSFVAQINIYPELVPQIRRLTGAFGGEYLGVRAVSYGSVVIDASSIQLFGGGSVPRKLAAVPTSAIADVRISRVLQGKWVLGTIEIEFVDGNSRYLANFCLLRWTWFLPRIVKGEALDEQLAAFRDALAIRQN